MASARHVIASALFGIVGSVADSATGGADVLAGTFNGVAGGNCKAGSQKQDSCNLANHIILHRSVRRTLSKPFPPIFKREPGDAERGDTASPGSGSDSESGGDGSLSESENAVVESRFRNFLHRHWLRQRHAGRRIWNLHMQAGVSLLNRNDPKETDDGRTPDRSNESRSACRHNPAHHPLCAWYFTGIGSDRDDRGAAAVTSFLNHRRERA